MAQWLCWVFSLMFFKILGILCLLMLSLSITTVNINIYPTYLIYIMICLAHGVCIYTEKTIPIQCTIAKTNIVLRRTRFHQGNDLC